MRGHRVVRGWLRGALGKVEKNTFFTKKVIKKKVEKPYFFFTFL